MRFLFVLAFLAAPAISNATDSAKCLSQALNSGLSQDNAVKLCAGSQGDYTFSCYVKAHNSGLTGNDAIELCRLSVDDEPFRCYVSSRNNGGLDPSQAVALCKASNRRCP